ncbi:hypothetical protein [Halobacillus trueperi]|uniref:Lipoprotein n=1 Tax=Halobacillus trueperi TaxID=156205 RepID=A0A3E0IYA4_9BACI|nr:hypothetical protein [Halobacillus trueperi]REJ05629.1 hypothetical protein DYE48_20305 [Halobacillus trueperi]
MKKYYVCYILLLFLVACSNGEAESTESNEDDTLQSKLNIAVVGSPPSVETDKVTYTTIELSKLIKDNATLEEYDALFIMPDVFKEASQDKYTLSFKEVVIPTVFINTKKRHLPFVTEGMSYENAPKVIETDHFAVIYMYSGGEENREDIWYVEKKGSEEKNYQKLYERIENL